MKIGYLGPNGSFTHNVALAVFPQEELIAFDSITNVIQNKENDFVDYAIVPVENAIEGSVHESIDYLFHQSNLEAIYEIIQPIKQCLLVTDLSKEIEVVYSHPQAIAQSRKFIEKYYQNISFEVTSSTAFAAKFISENPEKPFAAIAPLAAQKEYGLKILEKDIQEIDANFTRFWILGSRKYEKQISLERKKSKMSLALTLPNNLPGALYKALSVFAWRGIDLTKIESRPLKTVLGEYYFIIDLLLENETLLAYALEELLNIGINFKVLGKYPVYIMGD